MTDEYIPFEKVTFPMAAYKPARELYYSVDVETDGPIPGPHSMLSFGCAVFDDKGPYNSMMFQANLHTLPGATMHPDTMKFWGENSEAYAATRKNLKDPMIAMSEFNAWVNKISRKTETRPVLVAYPAGFDFMFMYWYMIKFTGQSPFSFSALDMKSYACAKLNIPYRASAKRNFPPEWYEGLPAHNHIALDDAIEQGYLFMNMKKHPLVGPRPPYKLGKI